MPRAVLAFSDGVVAIIITIMVLELKVPDGAGLNDLAGVLPIFLSYVLSFVYVAIYWTNHHHLLYTVNRVDGLILWANTHLLFWLSLAPFAAAWMGANRFAELPTAVYGRCSCPRSPVTCCWRRSFAERRWDRRSPRRPSDIKGKISPVLYAAAIPLSFADPLMAGLIYVSVALMWIIPARRIERELAK